MLPASISPGRSELGHVDHRQVGWKFRAMQYILLS